MLQDVPDMYHALEQHKIYLGPILERTIQENNETDCKKILFHSHE